jgi:hypothetical protein
MHTLIIRHLGSEGDRYRCQVWRPDGKVAEEVLLTAPDDICVEGRPNSNLSLDLRWYLERFLDYPFAPQTEVAERVQEALRAWGEQAFVALFHSGRGRDFYHDAYRNGLENLTLKIASDDPHLLAWPWEALRDPQTSGTLAHHARIERQLSGQHDPLDLPDQLPRDRINILLITARPYAGDVGFRALSRPMLDLIRQGNLPPRVDLLLPPTFEQLRQHLQQRPVFELCGASFHTALTEAEALEMDQRGAALTWALAVYAQRQRDFAQAEQWYRKSLAIAEKQGDEYGAASTYHQLGRIAQEQPDFAQAEQWYRKSLAIAEK